MMLLDNKAMIKNFFRFTLLIPAPIQTISSGKIGIINKSIMTIVSFFSQSGNITQVAFH